MDDEPSRRRKIVQPIVILATAILVAGGIAWIIYVVGQLAIAIGGRGH
jgi:hypothetical protein